MIPSVVDADFVADHPEAVLVDVRWYLDGRDGFAAYRDAHLPGARWVDLEIGLGLLFSGIVTIAGLWLEQHPDLAPDVPPEARADWDALLDRVLLRLRIGHPG